MNQGIPVWAYVVTCVLGTVLIAAAYLWGRSSMSDEMDAEAKEIRDLLADARIRAKDMRNRYAQLLHQKGSAIREAQFWKRTAKNLGWHKGLQPDRKVCLDLDPVPTEIVQK